MAAATPTYSLDRKGSEFIIRVSSDVVSEEELTQLLDYLVLQSIRNRSSLTADDAAMLAREVKRAAWERVRPLFEGG